LYAKDDPYLLDDATCAVVDPLVVDFKPRHGDSQATLDLEYDFLLAPKST
jgi:catechol 1,2-dioxygenase